MYEKKICFSGLFIFTFARTCAIFQHMDINLYNTLKAQAEEEYQKAFALAEQSRSKALEAIETVWQMLRDKTVKSAQNNPIVPVEPKQNIEIPPNEYGSLTAEVKHQISLMPKRFTKKDLAKSLNRDVSYNSIDGCLKRLKKQGVIKMVVKGSGRRPNKYSKIINEDDLF